MMENEKALPDSSAQRIAPPRAPQAKTRTQKYKTAAEVHPYIFIIHNHAICFVDNYFCQKTQQHIVEEESYRARTKTLFRL